MRLPSASASAAVAAGVAMAPGRLDLSALDPCHKHPRAMASAAAVGAASSSSSTAAASSGLLAAAAATTTARVTHGALVVDAEGREPNDGGDPHSLACGIGQARLEPGLRGATAVAGEAAAAAADEQRYSEGLEDFCFPCIDSAPPWNPEDPAVQFGGSLGDLDPLFQHSVWDDEEMSLEHQMDLFGELP